MIVSPVACLPVIRVGYTGGNTHGQVIARKERVLLSVLGIMLYLSVCLSIYLCIYLSVYLSFNFSI